MAANRGRCPPMSAGWEQSPRAWKEQPPGNWTNGCSLSEILRCQGELNVFHVLPIGASGTFADRNFGQTLKLGRFVRWTAKTHKPRFKRNKTMSRRGQMEPAVIRFALADSIAF